MTLGTSLLLIAVGAILSYAVEDRVPGVDLGAIGVILMIVGVVGLLVGLVLYGRRRDVLVRDRMVERDPYV